MTALDSIEEALYQVFTTMILFPDNEKLERYCRVLCELGYAEESAQDHATGYRITPRGHQAAMAEWGHEQR